MPLLKQSRKFWADVAKTLAIHHAPACLQPHRTRIRNIANAYSFWHSTSTHGRNFCTQLYRLIEWGNDNRPQYANNWREKTEIADPISLALQRKEYRWGRLYECDTGGGVPINYLVDSYKDLSGEGLITMILIRNVMSFAFNYGITPWLTTNGIQNTLVAVGMLAFGFTATFFFFVKFGKSLRRRSAKMYWAYVEKSIGSIH